VVVEYPARGCSGQQQGGYRYSITVKAGDMVIRPKGVFGTYCVDAR
jgi:hypothetical protein